MLQKFLSIMRQSYQAARDATYVAYDGDGNDRYTRLCRCPECSLTQVVNATMYGDRKCADPKCGTVVSSLFNRCDRKVRV